MLQLQAKSIDICRLSKILVKHNINASISNSVITLKSDVSDELITKLCDGININAIQNYISDVSTETTSDESEERFKNEVVDSNENKTTEKSTTLSQNFPEYDLIYKKVKRGEVYMCDLGEPYGSEQGLIRPVIIIQNDVGNLFSPTTIVVPCTTEKKKNIPTHYNTFFSSKNMIDFDISKIGYKENVILVEQILTVDKTKLRRYLGTLTPEIMEKIEKKIDVSLNLSREVKTIVKYVEKPTPVAEDPKGRKDVNMTQVQILSLVDIKELMKISQSSFKVEDKVQKILELFGFDFNKKGVQYLLKAIITSPKNDYFNLETLVKNVSKEESDDEEEIKRLIVARVKETFGFKKAPTIDFIRLVNNLIGG